MCVYITSSRRLVGHLRVIRTETYTYIHIMKAFVTRTIVEHKGRGMWNLHDRFPTHNFAIFARISVTEVLRVFPYNGKLSTTLAVHVEQQIQCLCLPYVRRITFDANNV